MLIRQVWGEPPGSQSAKAAARAVSLGSVGLENTVEIDGVTLAGGDRVLRLLEKHELGALERAVEEGLRIHAHSRDAIAQFLYPQEDWRRTVFRLDGREHLRHVKVAASDIGAYSELLGETGGVR